MDGYDVLVSVLDDASAIGRRGKLPHRGKKQSSDDGEHLHQMTPCEVQRKGLHRHFSFFGNSYLLRTYGRRTTARSMEQEAQVPSALRQGRRVRTRHSPPTC